MTKVVRTFPCAVREIENCWIPLSDGCRLAARIWMPEDAGREPVPAILEYIPYRKRDFTRGRDGPIHRYFAGHGYAAVRVDLRGCGDSDGLLADEYLPQEQTDALEVIEWLARQPWCSGAAGMMGISWGGFNALQVAARRPPRLKAIITLCASDDRYADDAHYMGGCLLNENLTWGSVLMSFGAYPPDPQLVGERWRELWRQRLDALPPFPALWLEHQRRDGYWKQGSVAEDFGRIACPVYAVGGWADGYSNAVPRLLAGLKVPRKGLIGPWAHVFPHDGVPGPRIGFLQEALRWWDHWLKGIDTGIMDEPMYRVWMQERADPRPFYEQRPGRWVAERAWPSRRIEQRTIPLGTGAAEELALRSPQTAGLGGGDWCAFGVEGEMPVDQREDDGRSACFDSEPLRERLEILGAAEAELELSVDRPCAQVCVRLCDVAPDGGSARVSYGLLNLTHRDGHERPEPLVAGRRYRVTVQLNDAAHAFAAGHRLRVSVSTAYWPIAWPAPQAVTVTLWPRGAVLRLPVRPPDASDGDLPYFAAPEQAPPPARTPLRPARMERTVTRDLVADETICTIFSEGADLDGAALAWMEAIDLHIGYSILRRYRIGEQDPETAAAEVEQCTLLRREGWSIRVEIRTALRATAEAFHFEAELEAWEGREQVAQRRWDRSLRRDLV